VLLHVADLSSKQNRRLATNVFFANSHFAALGLDQAIEAAQKRRLAGPAFSDQRYGPACRNVDAHVVERYHAPEAMRDIPRGQ